jgi:hypothetical protein
MNEMTQEEMEALSFKNPESAEKTILDDEKWDYLDDYVPQPSEHAEDYEYFTIPDPNKSMSIEYLLADDPLAAYWGVEDIGDALASGEIDIEDFEYEEPSRRFVLTEEQLEQRRFYAYVEGRYSGDYIPTEKALEWRAKFIADPNFIPF